MRLKNFISLMFACGLYIVVFAEAIDTSGNPVVGATLFGDIDGRETTFTDLVTKFYELGDFSTTNALTESLTQEAFMGIVGPYTPWENDWSNDLAKVFPAMPSWDGYQWNFNFTNAEGKATTYGISLTHNLTNMVCNVEGTDCHFWRYGTTQYTNIFGFATLSNLISCVKYPDLDYYMNKKEFDDYDASYGMSDKLTDENQTVTFLNFTNAEPTAIDIKIPKSGRCKDWIVYVMATTNVSIRLPNAAGDNIAWWLTEEAVTNDIPGGVATALYFSQVTDTPLQVFTMGRRSFVPIQLETSEQARFRSMMDKMANGRKRVFYRRRK